MTNRYVRSTDGNNADNGSTWALAKATIVGADVIDAAGDDIWVSQVHAESTAAPVAVGFAGTRGSISRLMCGNDAAEPPTALATTATVTTTGNSNIGVSGAAAGAIYVYGITFKVATGATGNFFNAAGSASSRAVFEACEIWMVATGTTAGISLPSNTGSEVILKNCNLKFANTAQRIYLASLGSLNWRGGALVSGSSAIAQVIDGQNAAGMKAVIENVDLSGCSSNVSLAVNIVAGSYVVFRNCKLPASWTGTPLTTPSADARVSMFNCSDGAQNYKMWIVAYAGSIRDETTFVRAAGASDGTTSFSWKLVSVANCNFSSTPLYTDWINRWQETTGSPITVTVEILTDSATALNDDDVWLEVDYLGASGTPLGSTISDAKSSVIATAANQTSSSETWTTTGMSNPQKRKLSVTLTPQMKGFIRGRVGVGKASATIYVDPKMAVT